MWGAGGASGARFAAFPATAGERGAVPHIFGDPRAPSADGAMTETTLNGRDGYAHSTGREGER